MFFLEQNVPYTHIKPTSKTQSNVFTLSAVDLTFPSVAIWAFKVYARVSDWTNDIADTIWQYTALPVCSVVCKVEVKQSVYRPGQALRVPGGWASQISYQLAHESGKVVSCTHQLLFPPPKEKLFVVLISIRGWVHPRAIVWPEGLWLWHHQVSNILLDVDAENIHSAVQKFPD